MEQLLLLHFSHWYAWDWKSMFYLYFLKIYLSENLEKILITASFVKKQTFGCFDIIGLLRHILFVLMLWSKRIPSYNSWLGTTGITTLGLRYLFNTYVLVEVWNLDSGVFITLILINHILTPTHSSWIIGGTSSFPSL